MEHFPCGNEGYNPLLPTDATTSCCLPTFDSDYRPILGFETFLGTTYATNNLGSGMCPSGSLNTAPPSSWLPADDYVEMK